MRTYPSPVLAVVFTLFVCSHAAAQTDAVVVGAQPMPGQSQRVQTTQIIQMKMVPEGDAPPGFPADGVRVEQTMVSVMRHEVGQTDTAGRVRHDITYESMKQTIKLNGADVPLPPGQPNPLDGKAFTMWMDQNNEVVEVLVPDGVGMTAEQARQLLSTMFAAVPRQAIRVGETVSKPFAMELPVPGGAAAPKMTATTHLTLAKLDDTGADRVAYFDLRFEGGLKADGSTTGPEMSMTLGGTGTMQMLVGSGFVIANNSEQSIDGRFGAPGDKSKMMTLRGTVTIKSARVE
jgi:hypothetical protein